MDEGDRYTLGLLLELRDLAREASDTNSTLTDRFQQLLRSVSNTNTPEIGKDFPFRVRQFAGASENLLRTVSLNCNVELARAAYETAKKIYPADRLVLLWGSWVVEEHMPPSDVR